MDYFIALAPPIGLGLLFVLVVRAFVTADRRERAAAAQLRGDVLDKLRREAAEAENGEPATGAQPGEPTR